MGCLGTQFRGSRQHVHAVQPDDCDRAAGEKLEAHASRGSAASRINATAPE
eukprot:gene7028-8679_t